MMSKCKQVHLTKNPCPPFFSQFNNPGQPKGGDSGLDGLSGFPKPHMLGTFLFALRQAKERRGNKKGGGLLTEVYHHTYGSKTMMEGGGNEAIMLQGF